MNRLKLLFVVMALCGVAPAASSTITIYLPANVGFSVDGVPREANGSETRVLGTPDLPQGTHSYSISVTYP